MVLPGRLVLWGVSLLQAAVIGSIGAGAGTVIAAAVSGFFLVVNTAVTLYLTRRTLKGPRKRGKTRRPRATHNASNRKRS